MTSRAASRQRGTRLVFLSSIFNLKLMLACLRSNHAFHLSGRRLTHSFFFFPSPLSRHSRIVSFTHPQYSTRPESANNTDVSHSEFLADAGSDSSWKESQANSLDGGSGAVADELDNLTAGKGKLAPTSSHLFNRCRTSAGSSSPPLAPATPNISFRSAPSAGQQFQWSDSTDVGDFIRDAARHAKFAICIGYDTADSESASEVTLDVEVPTVADRTRFLRRRLDYIGGQLKDMEALKVECDREAHRGARRMATAGFGVLAVYWGTVARLTFWDYGWDVMEPITYLSGLSTVMAGYLWFLYQGREVSYSSVLDRSISARRETLYKARGFDIEHWMDLVSEARRLRSEIRRIAEDYEDSSGWELSSFTSLPPSSSKHAQPSMNVDLKKTRLKWRGGSREQLPKFNPQLPRSIWEQFKKDFPDSIVFTPFFSDMRYEILTLKQNCISLEAPEGHRQESEDPQDRPVRFDDFFPPVLTAASWKKTDIGTMGGSWLHLAVSRGDFPLAYECVRLGTPIEFKDRRGYTALYFACVTVKNFILPDGPVTLQVHLPEKPTDIEKFVDGFISQLIQICHLLLEQHADANETHDGLSLLGLACLSDQLDLIRALLLHGANPSPSATPAKRRVQFFRTQHNKKKFDNLAAEFAGRPRPRRLCPCGSKRVLEDCHSSIQPYPDKGICPCGAGKIYEKCCVKLQEMYWVERWNPCIGRLQRAPITRMTLDPEIQKMCEEQQFRAAHDLKSELGEQPQLFLNYIRAVLKELEENGEIDPAYAAVGLKVHFSPMCPQVAHTMSRSELMGTIRLWNAAVDEYIASGVDSRPAEVIENATKVGTTGGPLHRRCEAAGCPSIEFRNGAKLSVCSGCKKAVYCSHNCQKSAWRVHKKACRAGKVLAQMLPSQEAYAKQLDLGFREIASALPSDVVSAFLMFNGLKAFYST
ncbi:Calcium uniporter protein 5, mitochondrial [Mycena venus]|uniref:Calcium uniporter protein, mitochondrial n=1 Tax=Mycena venus TaxID=2733690 RepID=A0A8H6XMY5_9AGAR|nr:Calcium uniporter protein 5, mitochondrial [Mycena venus]